MDIAGQARTINTKTVRPRGPKPRRAKPAPGMGDVSTWFSDEVYSTLDPADYNRDSVVLTGSAPQPIESFSSALSESVGNVSASLSSFVSQYGSWLVIGAIAYFVILPSLKDDHGD